MAAHGGHDGEAAVETGDINHAIVVSFVVVLTVAVLAAFLVVNYLYQFLVHLEADRKIVDDPQVAERHKRFDGAEVEEFKQKYLFSKGKGKLLEESEAKRANDPDWQEYVVARDRVLVHGIHRPKLPPSPTLESADVLDPLHSGTVRDPFTLGQENIREGNLLLDPESPLVKVSEEEKKHALEKLKKEKKLTMSESFKAIVDKKVLKSAGK